MSIDQVKPGVETSEFKVAKASGFFAYFSVIAATVIAYGPQVMGWLPEGSTAGIIVAAVLGGIGVAQKLFVDLGYLKSRTDVKVQADAKPAE